MKNSVTKESQANCARSCEARATNSAENDNMNFNSVKEFTETIYEVDNFLNVAPATAFVRI